MRRVGTPTFTGGMLLAACVTLGAVTACSSASPSNGTAGSNDPGTMLSTAANAAESAIVRVGERLGLSLQPAPSSPPPPVTFPAPAVEPPRRAATRRRAAANPVPVVTPVVASEPAPAEVPPAPEVLPPPEPVAVAPAPAPVVYSSADAEVAPPRAPVPTVLHPWRPSTSEPGPAVEVTVDETGQVAKVRMLSAMRLPDMMLLSHIKSWRFEPAMREGTPVRYRVMLNDPVVAP